MSTIGIIRAAKWATYFHKDQKRRYTGEPYMLHCFEVAEQIVSFRHLIEDLLPAGASVDHLVQAALLHDALEDTEALYKDISVNFSPCVADLVAGLTDRFTPEAFPAMNREARKAAERLLLGAQPMAVQFIKAFDLLDNLKDIVEYDAPFAKVYISECEATVSVLTKLTHKVREMLDKALETAKDQMT